jgi:hypothetical protein
MTKEEIEELEMLYEKLGRLDGGRGIALPRTRDPADTLIGLIARFNYLQGKKEEHDKVIKVINYIDQCTEANKYNAKSCGELPSEIIGNVLKNIKLSILEKLQS